MSSDSVAVNQDGRRRPAVNSALTSEQQPNPKEKCPRCESRDTKFCYYNNYNTSQPRHFCRSCRRYWTLGGSLRNVPIGGSSRSSTNNNKRLRPNPNPNPIPINPTQVFAPIGSLRFELGLGLKSGTPASMADMRFGLGPTTMIWPSAMMENGAGGRDTWRVGDGSSGPVDGEVR